ncbi:hypothetical protein [Nonomuraea dietziae]|uniref:hypothetical protein n=1 Tax=Nonomuraea dietziae TaxID=65515 RepID=UPI0033F03747
MPETLELVSPERVAVRAGLSLPLDPSQRETVAEALDDALGEVAAFLGKPPVPWTVTERGVSGDGRGGWRLRHHPVVEIQSVTAETDPVSGGLSGLYTVVYTAGLDPAADRVYGMALARYLAAAAAASPMVRRLAQDVPGARLVKRANVEGQGVEFEDAAGTAGSGAAGAPPALDSLKRWRKRGAFQEPGIAPHPLEVTWSRPWW